MEKVMVPGDIFEDVFDNHELSWAAKGMFVFILNSGSKGISINEIRKHTKRGRQHTQTICDELLKTRYIRKKLTANNGYKLVACDDSLNKPSDKYGFPSLGEIKLKSQKVTDSRYGVYFLLFRDEFVYIGSSSAPAARVHNHIQNQKFHFDSYFIMECKESDMMELEGEYIDYYNPTENVIGK